MLVIPQNIGPLGSRRKIATGTPLSTFSVVSDPTAFSTGQYTYIRYPLPADLQGMVQLSHGIHFWMRPTDVTSGFTQPDGFQRLIDFDSNCFVVMFNYPINGALNVFCSAVASGHAAWAGGNYVANEWYSVYGEFEHLGSNLGNYRLYVNGVLRASQIASQSGPGVNATSVRFFGITEALQRFKGNIDDVRYYRQPTGRILSDQNVLDLSNGIDLQSPAPTLHWQFDEGVGTSSVEKILGLTNSEWVNVLWSSSVPTPLQ